MRRRLALASLWVFVVLALAGAAAFWWWREHGRPQRDGVATIESLRDPVRVRFDDAGVPHVEARSLADLSRALGWLHANDRIGQMELQRRYVSGRLAELVGEAAVRSDVAMRELRLARVAEQMLAKLSPRSREALDAYAEGVNAWLESRDGDLPPDLVLLRADPEPWSARDSLATELLMAHVLSFSEGRERSRLRWLGGLGEKLARDLIGVANVPIAPEIVELAPRSVSTPIAPTPQNGSNNWAVDGTRSANGHALVANDPHLALGLPSLWYQALVRSPEYEASGFTIPGVPMVVIGQGPRVAWGFTNTELDVCDVFVERVSEDGRSVERDGAWVPIVVERETVRVKGGEDIGVVLRSTDVGPFFAKGSREPLLDFSLAWSAYEPFDPVEPFFALAGAENVDDVPRRIEGFLCPVQNLVCGDANGAILYTVLGRSVERGFGDGRLPVPAWRSANHWRGLQPHANVPSRARPNDALLATANDDTRPEGFAHSFPIDSAAPQRAQRIRERLAERRDWSASAFGRLQTDATSLYALDLVRALPEFGPGDSEAARNALAELREWNGEMAVSGRSALYALVEHELDLRVFGRRLRELGLPRLGHPELKPALLRALRGELDGEWVGADDAQRRETVSAALERAWRDGVQRWGRDVELWSYGEMHAWRPHHKLGDVPLLGACFDEADIGVPGSDTSPCVFHGRWNGEHIEVEHGASLRISADCGDPDLSLAILPGGQSGHPFDEHYSDQLAGFAAGSLRPMHWSEASIEAAARHRLELRPLQR